uniref:Uncharacterized protein n=1 Tax=viral metagenome TaxID=1070528 RepID=A0A6C0B1B3_9ZZZZ
MKKNIAFTTLNLVSQNQYSFHFMEQHKPLIESIFMLLQKEGACIIMNEGKMSSLEFCAHSVEPLVDFIKKDGVFNNVHCIHLIESLYYQSTLLENYSLGLYCLDMNEIYVINSSIFICIQPTFIKEVKIEVNRDRYGEKNYFSFLSPIRRDLETCFFAPEITNLVAIPAIIPYKCFYYSLGALAVYCLFKKKMDSCNATILNPIAGTKLYWMLLKMLETDCKNRFILYL